MSKATFNNDLSRIGLALLTAAVLLCGVALVGLTAGSAAAAEIGNETVTINNNTDAVVVETAWNDSFGDTADTTASVEITNVDDDTTAHSVEISGVEGSTVSREINVSDAGLEAEQEYRVTVDGSEGVLQNASIGTLGGGGGLIGAATGSISPLHAAVGVGFVLLLLVLVARFTDYDE